MASIAVISMGDDIADRAVAWLLMVPAATVLRLVRYGAAPRWHGDAAKALEGQCSVGYNSLVDSPKGKRTRSGRSRDRGSRRAGALPRPSAITAVVPVGERTMCGQSSPPTNTSRSVAISLLLMSLSLGVS